MTRILPTFLLAYFVFLSAVYGHAQQAQDPDQFISKHSESKELVQALEKLKYHGFSGTVLGAVKGEVRVAYGVGYANREKKEANTANTLFELASVTKQFTGAAICLLMDSKKLKLDDPISKHLPGVPDSSKKITIRHLLHHTSGIPGSNSFGAGFELKPVVASFLKGGPKNKPGEKHEYWNQGYALLAGIVQTTSGQTYPEFCTKHLFRSTGMKTACFTGGQRPKNAQVATGYSTKGLPRTALEHPYREYGFQYQGMGGAVSNVWDLWRWNQALQKKKLLSSKASKALFKPGPSDYSFGWRISDKDGLLTQSHSGSVRGFVSEMRRYPKKKAFVAVLCNDDDFSPGRVAQIVEDALLRGEIPDIPGAVPEEMQQRLVGKYKHAKGHRLEISVNREATMAKVYWAQGYRSFGSMGMNEDKELICFPLFDPCKLNVKYEDDVARSIDLGYGAFQRQE